jgi:hypothetical protein
MSLFSRPYLLYTLHSLVETIGIAGFLFIPSATLTVPQPHAHGVIRQYALSLLSLNCCIWTALYHRTFLAKALAPHPKETQQLRQGLALSLSVYHLGVAIRAVNSIMLGDREPPMLGSALIHLPLGLGFVVEALTGSKAEASGKAGKKR